MVLKINNVGKWRLLEIGNVIELSGGDFRRVRIEFNTDTPTRLVAVEHGAEEDTHTFVGVVFGYEIVEFTASGRVHLTADAEGEVWYFTDNISDAEAAAEAVEATTQVSFASVMQRAARNPHLELMQYKLEENMNRRLEAQREEFAAMLAAQQAAQPHNPETGEVIEDDEVGADDAGGAPEEAGADAIGGDPVPPKGAGEASRA